MAMASDNQGDNTPGTAAGVSLSRPEANAKRKSPPLSLQERMHLPIGHHRQQAGLLGLPLETTEPPEKRQKHSHEHHPAEPRTEGHNNPSLVAHPTRPVLATPIMVSASQQASLGMPMPQHLSIVGQNAVPAPGALMDPSMMGHVSFPGVMLQCAECHKTFPCRSKLDRHMRIHTGDKPYKCEQCPKTFSDRSHLKVHMRTHNGDKPYKCEHCDRSFSVRSTLVYHERTHTGERPFKCHLCDRAFSRKTFLKAHLRTHSGEQLFCCDECGRTFPHKAHLSSHLRSHRTTRRRRFQCTQCEKTFMRKEHLDVHNRTHTGEKPFVCSICDRSFRHKSALTVHARKHSGDKPYKCEHEDCDQRFTSAGSLLVHRRIHTGDRPYKCNECHRGFTTKSHLTRHLKSQRSHSNLMGSLDDGNLPRGQVVTGSHSSATNVLNNAGGILNAKVLQPAPQMLSRGPVLLMQQSHHPSIVMPVSSQPNTPVPSATQPLSQPQAPLLSPHQQQQQQQQQRVMSNQLHQPIEQDAHEHQVRLMDPQAVHAQHMHNHLLQAHQRQQQQQQQQRQQQQNPHQSVIHQPTAQLPGSGLMHPLMNDPRSSTR